MSSTTNIPINTRSMNGIITISDGIATMENGNLTDINTLDANSTNSTVMTTTTQPPGTNDTTVATTAFVNNNLLAYALLNPPTPQTFTGTNTFGVLNASTPGTANNSIRVATTAYVKSNLLSYALLGSDNTFTANNNFTTQLTTNNSTLAATTAYVKSNLLSYALLGSDNTFTANNNFITQLTTNNSTLAATTAYVKGQNYITSAALSDYVTLNTSQTITANKTFNGTTTLNNLFVSNYVDPTLTTYENQFFGDIYGYRGVVCENGLYIKDGPGAGANTYALIDASGNISSTSTISASGNISSTSEISCTGILSSDTGLNIPSITPLITINNNGTISQTSTGTNSLFNTTFTGTVNQINIKAFVNAGASTISQQTNSLIISAVTNNTGAFATTLTLSTRSSTNTGVVLLSGNASTINIGANTTNLNLSSTNCVISGNTSFTNTTTPTITQAILLTDNSTKIATTAYVKGQSYLIASDLAPYALTSSLSSYALISSLSSYSLLTANQTFTGTNTFTNTVPNAPIAIKNTSSSSVGIFVISGTGSYNGINSPGDFSVVATGTAVNTGVLTLTTYASGYCGIKIKNDTIEFNAPVTCNYYTLPTVPPLNAYDIGHNWEIPGAVFAPWTGFTTPQNVATINFTGVGSRKMGVWKVDVVLCTECTGAPASRLIWTTVSTTSGDLTPTCTHEDNAAVFGAIGVQIMRLSFTLVVTTIPSTYYLNYFRVAGIGSGLVANQTNSKITFTRMG